MKFSQMPYKRVELEPALAKIRGQLDAFKGAETAEEAIAAYEAYDKYSQNIETMFMLGGIRHTLDTADSFYDAENDYIDKTGPEFMPIEQEFARALLESPFRNEMEAKWGSVMFRKAELELKTFRPEIVPDLQEANKLASEYEKLLASAQIEYDGKTLTLAQLGSYHESPDRAIRESSMRARAEWFLRQAPALDDIFDRLVKLRAQMARKLGYGNFVEMGYDLMERLCYRAPEVEKFRAAVAARMVPVSVRLKEEQARRIGVDRIKIYDDRCLYLDGNAKPKGTPEEIFAHGKKMYHGLSGDTAKFIDFMLENELFDVLTRPGKAGGGYCAYLEDYKSPFIFANFNGTADDINVLTHEAGHAFAAYEARELSPSSLRGYSMETAEIHSMAMEFFAWPHMEGFFGGDADKARESHMLECLTFIPYGAMVDEFQHRVYEKPEMRPQERNALWLSLEAKYRPYLDFAGFPFYGEGRRWQAQSHIYTSPFYYIDYCLAQTMALQFWALGQNSHRDAWEKYCRLVKFAGTKTFSELVRDAGLLTPFGDEAVKKVCETVAKWLDERAKG